MLALAWEAPKDSSQAGAEYTHSSLSACLKRVREQICLCLFGLLVRCVTFLRSYTSSASLNIDFHLTQHPVHGPAIQRNPRWKNARHTLQIHMRYSTSRQKTKPKLEIRKELRPNFEKLLND